MEAVVSSKLLVQYSLNVRDSIGTDKTVVNIQNYMQYKMPVFFPQHVR